MYIILFKSISSANIITSEQAATINKGEPTPEVYRNIYR